MSQIFNPFNSDNFKEALASTKDEDDEEEKEEKDQEDSLEQKICNKLFESKTCEKGNEEDKPVEKKELTEEEIKAEALINRYLEPIELEQKSTIDNSLNSETEIGNNNSGSSINNSSTLFSNEIASTGVTNTNQQINSGQQSTQINQPPVNNPNVSGNTPNLNTLNQFQLVDLIASTISNANNIDKNKLTQSLNDFIEPTKAKGDNVIELLKKISGIISKDPSGDVAMNIINAANKK